MLIYTDAGRTRHFKYFIFTDMVGTIMGYKLDVTRPGDFPPEIDGVIAALYWAKLHTGRHTIMTDYQPTVSLLTGKWVPKGKDLKELQVLGRTLLLEANANLTWIPRQINIAGKILENMPKGKKSRDADELLGYLKSKKGAL